MSIGIYKITNSINGKIYIGQSTNIEKRWDSEKKRAFQPSARSYDTLLSRAFRKYGVDNFIFEIIEECPQQELNDKEKYYIYKLNSLFPNGYNMTTGGNSWSQPVKLVLSQVEEITQLLCDTSLTNLQIANQFNVSENMISGINTGYYWKRPNIDYPIRKKNNLNRTKTNKICPVCGQQISTSADYCIIHAGEHRRKITRPSREELKKLIREYPFTKIAEFYNVTDNSIRKWCIAYSLPHKKREIMKITDKDWEKI